MTTMMNFGNNNDAAENDIVTIICKDDVDDYDHEYITTMMVVM